VAAILVWAELSARQTRHWHDSGTLFAHSIGCTGPNGTALLALGAYLAEQERWGEATERLSQAVAFYDTDARVEAHDILAVALMHLGRDGEAADQFRRVYELDPTRADARGNQLAAHFREGTRQATAGRPREALRQFDAVLAVDPGHAPARQNKAVVCYNLGLTAAHAGRPADARARDNLADVLRHLPH
jgi:Tfp pilus assembly protein PilF